MEINLILNLFWTQKLTLIFCTNENSPLEPTHPSAKIFKVFQSCVQLFKLGTLDSISVYSSAVEFTLWKAYVPPSRFLEHMQFGKLLQSHFLTMWLGKHIWQTVGESYHLQNKDSGYNY